MFSKKTYHSSITVDRKEWSRFSRRSFHHLSEAKELAIWSHWYLLEFLKCFVVVLNRRDRKLLQITQDPEYFFNESTFSREEWDESSRWYILGYFPSIWNQNKFPVLQDALLRMTNNKRVLNFVSVPHPQVWWTYTLTAFFDQLWKL